MKIRHLEVRNFRGIKSLAWRVTGVFNCIIGCGDARKTTILTQEAGANTKTRSQAEIMMRIASEFGFTPASRSRIATPQQPERALFDVAIDPQSEPTH